MDPSTSKTRAWYSGAAAAISASIRHTTSQGDVRFSYNGPLKEDMADSWSAAEVTESQLRAPVAR
jgi:hypothetical protein